MAQQLTETLIPYARSIPVKLLAQNLAPNRKHYIYINDILCNMYIKAISITTGQINNITMVSVGSGYNANTTKVNFIGSNTKIAKATANVVGNSILGIDLADRGAGYYPNVYISITGSGTGAYAVPGIAFVPGADLLTDAYGKVEFSMMIPNDSVLKFPTGKLTFTISDHPVDPSLGKSTAFCTFASVGILQTLTEVKEKIDVVPAPSAPVKKKKDIPQTSSWYWKNPVGNTEIKPLTTVTYTNLETPNFISTVTDIYGNVTTYDYYSSQVENFEENIDVFSATSDLKALNAANLLNVVGKMNSDGTLSVNADLNVTGKPLYNGSTPIWNGITDGTAFLNFSIPVPEGYIVPTNVQSALIINVTNQKNQKKSYKKVSATYVPSIRKIQVTITFDETSDKKQNYKVDIKLKTQPDLVKYSGKFTTTIKETFDSNNNIISSTTANTVPSGIVLQQRTSTDPILGATELNQADIGFSETQIVTNPGVVTNTQQIVIGQNYGSAELEQQVGSYIKESMHPAANSSFQYWVNAVKTGTATPEEAKAQIDNAVKVSPLTTLPAGSNSTNSNVDGVKAAIIKGVNQTIDALIADGKVYDPTKVTASAG